MILMDTTVLVHYLRTGSAAVKAVLETGQAAICGVTRAEILHGAKTPADAKSLAAALDALPQVPVDEDIWDDLGLNLSALRSRGLPVPFPDALIATVAIRHGLEVWTYDNHFTAIRTALAALQLFNGPRPTGH